MSEHFTHFRATHYKVAPFDAFGLGGLDWSEILELDLPASLQVKTADN